MGVKILLNYQLKNEVSQANFNNYKSIYNWQPFITRVYETGVKRSRPGHLIPYYCSNTKPIQLVILTKHSRIGSKMTSSSKWPIVIAAAAFVVVVVVVVV